MSQSATVPVARGPRSGWKVDEIEALRQAVLNANDNGEPLRGVFDRISRSLGRKPNSIRNFYYAQLKGAQQPGTPRALPFKTFSENDMRELLRGVLRGRAEGLSVRACVHRMAGGDKTLMLRYQNKYRSLLKTRPTLVRDVMERLSSEGVRCRDPFVPRGVGPQSISVAQTEARLRESGDPALMQLLAGLNALISRCSDTEQSLAMERMQVRQDMLHTELNDVRAAHQHLREACSCLVQTSRDFLGLPAEARKAGMNTFCALLGEQVSSLEGALAGLHN